MDTRSQIVTHDSFKRFDFAGTSKGGGQKQHPGRAADWSNDSYSPTMETMTDQQSYGLMEERYGIREEGIF